MERDTSAGDTSIAVALGPRRAGLLVLLLHCIVAVMALGTAVVLGAPGGWVLAVAAACLVPVAGAALGVLASTRPGTSWREAAFDAQAVGTGLVAVAWLGALSAAAGMAAGG